jgi:hypothetical protein
MFLLLLRRLPLLLLLGRLLPVAALSRLPPPRHRILRSACLSQ